MQSNMQAPSQQEQGHEDLTNLFARGMTLNPEAQADMTAAPPGLEPMSGGMEPVRYSISQHYHHSAHVSRPPDQHDPVQAQKHEGRHEPEPPTSEEPTTESYLRTFGIDPTFLTPSQMQLFHATDQKTKLSLVYLWMICPPTKSEEIHQLAYLKSSLPQEVYLAHLRREMHGSSGMDMSGNVKNTPFDDPKLASAKFPDVEPSIVLG